jgi:hypothetical protein
MWVIKMLRQGGTPKQPTGSHSKVGGTNEAVLIDINW